MVIRYYQTLQHFHILHHFISIISLKLKCWLQHILVPFVQKQSSPWIRRQQDLLSPETGQLVPLHQRCLVCIRISLTCAQLRKLIGQCNPKGHATQVPRHYKFWPMSLAFNGSSERRGTIDLFMLHSQKMSKNVKAKKSLTAASSTIGNSRAGKSFLKLVSCSWLLFRGSGRSMWKWKLRTNKEQRCSPECALAQLKACSWVAAWSLCVESKGSAKQGIITDRVALSESKNCGMWKWPVTPQGQEMSRDAKSPHPVKVMLDFQELPFACRSRGHTHESIYELRLWESTLIHGQVWKWATKRAPNMA